MKATTHLFFLLAATMHAAAGNVLIIIADDYGIDSSSLYNANAAASLPPTPTIVSLKNSGVLFRNAYGHPTCSPTRASLLTGRHPFRTGVDQAITPTTGGQLQAAEMTLPEIFAANAPAYSCAQFGKWHLATGVNAPGTLGGWPHFSGTIPGALASYTSYTKVVNGTQTAGYTNYATSDVVDDAAAWIAARGTSPWFAWVAFNAGHTPLHKPPNNLHSYDALPGTTMHINNNPRSYYEAMVEAMDTEIARLLTGVNLAQTTVIFLGDNGTGGNVIQPPGTQTRAKGSLYEGGTHVPMIIAGAGIVAPNRESTAPVHAIDLFGEILDLAGISAATAIPGSVPIDSRSLLPILNDETESEPRTAYCEIGEDPANATNIPGRAIRNDRYKYIRFLTGGDAFYDLAIDPEETVNLLSTTLDATQQANFNCLSIKLANLQTAVPVPVITTTARSGGEFSISIQSVVGTTYELWRSTDLACASWAPVPGATQSLVGSTRTLTDPGASGSQYYYRVMATQ